MMARLTYAGSRLYFQTMVIARGALSALIVVASFAPSALCQQGASVIKKGDTVKQVEKLLGRPSPDAFAPSPAGGPGYVYERLSVDSTPNSILIGGRTGSPRRVVILFNREQRVWGWRFDDVVEKVTRSDTVPPARTGSPPQRIAQLGKKIRAKGLTLSSGEIFIPFCREVRREFGGEDGDRQRLIEFLASHDLAAEVDQCGIYHGQHWMEMGVMPHKSRGNYMVHEFNHQVFAKQWLADKGFDFSDEDNHNVSVWLKNHGFASVGDEAKLVKVSTAPLLPIEWVAIPAGSFVQTGVEDEPIEVRIPSFEVTRTAITNRQYEQCVKAKSCTPPHYRDGKCHVSDGSSDQVDGQALAGETHPVVCVDWKQAQAFARWSKARLLSRSEWEYAASNGGLDEKFPWGNDPESCERIIYYASEGKGCGRSATWPVCSVPAGNTKNGLCDMMGNARTWLQDTYQSSGERGAPPKDGSAWVVSGSHKMRVTSAGDWTSEWQGLNRPDASLPWSPLATVGIRLARTAKGAPKEK